MDEITKLKVASYDSMVQIELAQQLIQRHQGIMAANARKIAELETEAKKSPPKKEEKANE